MSAGYLKNAIASASSIGASYDKGDAVPLTVPAVGMPQGGPPNGAYWDCLELNLGPASNSGEAVAGDVTLWWDANCDYIAAGPLDIAELQPGLTDTTLRCAIVNIGRHMYWPTPDEEIGTRNTLYATFKVATGTLEIPAGGVKLHWNLGDRRGA